MVHTELCAWLFGPTPGHRAQWLGSGLSPGTHDRPASGACPHCGCIGAAYLPSCPGAYPSVCLSVCVCLLACLPTGGAQLQPLTLPPSKRPKCFGRSRPHLV